MAALLATRFPEKTPELLAYQASIVCAQRSLEGRRWVIYDRSYQQEALTVQNLDWSVPNLHHYNKAFTDHTRVIPRVIPRCSFCLQENHTAQACPRNPSRPWFGCYHNAEGHTQHPSGPRAQSPKCCQRYNEGKCHQMANTCRHMHKCLECGGLHPHPYCPHSGQGSYTQPRSPTASASIRRPSLLKGCQLIPHSELYT